MKINEDYLPNDEDDDIIRNIKERMLELTPMQYQIWMTYVEDGSYSKTAKKYNVSAPTAKKYINKIKKILGCSPDDLNN